MAQTLSRSAADQIVRALSTWRHWSSVSDDSSVTEQTSGGPPEAPVIEKILDGHSNLNVLVKSGASRFVIRINQDDPALGVDRETERTVLRDIREMPYSPDVVYITGTCLVTRYLPGSSGEVPVSPEDVAGLLKAIHGTPTRVTRKMEPGAHVKTYLHALRERNIPVPTELTRSNSFASITPQESYRLCHIDPNPENLVRSASGLKAIDWEYACLADPAFDLAVYSETATLSEADVQTLITDYGNPAVGERVAPMRHAYRVIEALWWMIRKNGPCIESADAMKRLARLGSPQQQI